MPSTVRIPVSIPIEVLDAAVLRRLEQVLAVVDGLEALMPRLQSSYECRLVPIAGPDLVAGDVPYCSTHSRPAPCPWGQLAYLARTLAALLERGTEPVADVAARLAAGWLLPVLTDPLVPTGETFLISHVPPPQPDDPGDDGACPHDPDGQHFIGCGCDAEDDS